MVFKSKIGAWFHVLAVLLVALTGLLTYLAFVRRAAVLYMAAAIFLLLMGLLVLPMWWNTKYILEETQLRIICGLSRRGIAYGDILAATPARDIASAPALSLDRVQIRYRTKDGDNNYIAVSPLDQAGFLQALARRVQPAAGQ